MNKILQDDSLCPSPPAEMKLGRAAIVLRAARVLVSCERVKAIFKWLPKSGGLDADSLSHH
jgi:hypothetical protein